MIEISMQDDQDDYWDDEDWDVDDWEMIIEIIRWWKGWW